MREEDDALIGLRFEVGGGLSRFAGRVLGKAGSLYLVHKTGVDYCELLQIDDLRSAKFFIDPPAEVAEIPAALPAPEIVAAAATPSEPEVSEPGPGKRRLADQLRRHLGRSEP